MITEAPLTPSSERRGGTHAAAIRYPGSKWSLADRIIELFRPHYHYVEPFFGSGAVFFSKPRVPHEVINDRNSQATNLFLVLRDQTRNYVGSWKLRHGPETNTTYRTSSRPTPLRTPVGSWCVAGRLMEATSLRKPAGRTVARVSGQGECLTDGIRFLNSYEG